MSRTIQRISPLMGVTPPQVALTNSGGMLGTVSWEVRYECERSESLQALALLSDGFERFAMMVAGLTRFLRQSPECSAIPGSFRGHAAFRKSTDLGILT